MPIHYFIHYGSQIMYRKYRIEFHAPGDNLGQVNFFGRKFKNSTQDINMTHSRILRPKMFASKDNIVQRSRVTIDSILVIYG